MHYGKQTNLLDRVSIFVIRRGTSASLDDMDPIVQALDKPLRNLDIKLKGFDTIV